MDIESEVSESRKKIFRDGYDMSFGEISSLYEKNELVINPEYQRLFRWNDRQKTGFIESLLLNIPIPPIFVFTTKRGEWELVDGLQRTSTVLEFMGLLKNADGKLMQPFVCQGTVSVPSLSGMSWNGGNDGSPLPLSLQINIRRARIRVEILGQETDARTKFELFQRLNTGGSLLSEQELRSCVISSIDPTALKTIKKAARNIAFEALTPIGGERAKRQYREELFIRFVVLRHVKYDKRLDVHEYLNSSIMSLLEKKFDWTREEQKFEAFIEKINSLVGKKAFLKNSKFSLAMYEFISLGASTAFDRKTLSDSDLKEKIQNAAQIENVKRYSGMGVRGTQRLSMLVFPHSKKYFS